MKHIFIVNPTSGKYSGKTAVPVIKSICEKHQLNYQIIETKARKHATEIAKRYFAKDQVTIYSVGGDGTLHEVLNGLNKDVPLAILPLGSGNDFYRMINPTIAPLNELIETTVFGKYIDIDYALRDNVRFINCLSMGFDAHINDLANKLLRKSALPKKLSYVTSALANIAAPKFINLTIEADDVIIKKECLLVAIMNGQYYGGGFNPSPDSKINDGYLDLCIIENLSRSNIIRLLKKFYSGQHTQLKTCTMLKAKKIRISSEDNLLMQSDGEGFYTKLINIEVKEKQLKLKVPFTSTLN